MIQREEHLGHAARVMAGQAWNPNQKAGYAFEVGDAGNHLGGLNYTVSAGHSPVSVYAASALR